MSGLATLRRAFRENPLTSAFGDVLERAGQLTHLALEGEAASAALVTSGDEGAEHGAATRVRLGGLLLSRLLEARDRALFVIDPETDREVPWYTRCGFDAPHLFVAGQLVAYFGRAHRPTAAQIAELLALETRPSALLGFVAAVDADFFECEGEDLSVEDWHAHLRTPSVLFASVAVAREAPQGFVALELAG